MVDEIEYTTLEDAEYTTTVPGVGFGDLAGNEVHAYEDGSVDWVSYTESDGDESTDFDPTAIANDARETTAIDFEEIDLDDLLPDLGDALFPWWTKYAVAGTVLLVVLFVLRPYVSIADSAVDTVGGVVR